MYSYVNVYQRVSLVSPRHFNRCFNISLARASSGATPANLCVEACDAGGGHVLLCHGGQTSQDWDVFSVFSL